MDMLHNIKYLLKKLKEDDLSLSETQELASHLEKGDLNEELKKELTEIWQDSEQDDIEVPSGQMLARLKRHLQIAEPGNALPKKSPFVRLIRPFFRYAALIVFTAGFTWIIKDRTTRRDFIDISPTPAEAFNDISVPLGSKTRVVLPDGSVVNLNSGSSLRYPARMDSSLRYAYVEGEAFFDIRKDSRHPFYVKTRDITIKVLGTKFNVKSYADEKTVETTLVSGKIEILSVKGIKSDKQQILVMKPNQQAIFQRLSGEIVISELPENSPEQEIRPVERRVFKKVDVNTIIAWKDNRLLFRDESFDELSRKLERWYDVDIEIQDKDLAKALFSGIFENETIEQALDALKLATPFKYKMNKNKIIISK